MTDYIELSMPAEPELLHLVRYHVASAAARADWSVDEVDDLRLAADELCLSLIGQAGRGDRRLNLKLAWSEKTIEMTCSLRGGEPSVQPPSNGNAPKQKPGLLPSELSERVLAALVDEHGTVLDHGRTLAWLRKQRIGSGRPG